MILLSSISINFQKHPELLKANLSKLLTIWIIQIHITSQLTPQPPLPHTLPEDIPSLVGGVFHVLAEGSPQWRFSRWGLSHIPYVQQLHIPTEKKLQFWRVSIPCGQRSLRHGSCRGCVWLKNSAQWGRKGEEEEEARGLTLDTKVCMQFVKLPCPLPRYTSLLLRKLCVCEELFMWWTNHYCVFSRGLMWRRVRVRSVFPLCMCVWVEELEDLAKLERGNDI